MPDPSPDTAKLKVSQQAPELSRWDDEDLSGGELLFNRELSQLAFNRRVLALASDEATPLLERLRFLCISCTNLDEFFEVRAAAVRQRLQYGANQPAADGLTPAATLEAIRAAVLDMVDEQYRVLNEALIPALAAEGIHILRRSQWSEAQRDWLHRHFQQELMPVLSPLGLDPAHPSHAS